MLRIAGVQHDIVWEDPAANFERLAPMIAEAATDADLVVLSEMYATGFSMEASRLSEPATGPTESFLVAQAKNLGVHVAASRPTLDPGFDRPVNQLMLIGPDGVVDRYTKNHPFSFAGEDQYYDAGPGPTTITINGSGGGVRVSPFICYDLRFATEFWDVAEQTDMYLVVANWPEARREHWMALLAARAIENQAYVVGINRVGEGGGLTYSGDSRIFSPLGEVLAAADKDEEILRATIDPEVVATTRATFPFLADRTTR